MSVWFYILVTDLFWLSSHNTFSSSFDWFLSSSRSRSFSLLSPISCTSSANVSLFSLLLYNSDISSSFSFNVWSLCYISCSKSLIIFSLSLIILFFSTSSLSNLSILSINLFLSCYTLLFLSHPLLLCILNSSIHDLDLLRLYTLT